MAHFIKQRCLMMKGFEEKGLMICTHGNDKIGCFQEFCGNPSLLVTGGIQQQKSLNLPGKDSVAFKEY
jgi:hypothetical protein